MNLQVDDVDVSTVAGAEQGIQIIDAAIAEINSQRATLGAVQSRFDSVVSNLVNVAENSSAARSRIVDADFAQETAQLAKTQILQRGGHLGSCAGQCAASERTGSAPVSY